MRAAFEIRRGGGVGCIAGLGLNVPHTIYIHFPISAETLEPLARFVSKLPKVSSFSDEGFPGLKTMEHLGPFSTNRSICSAERP